MLTSKLWLSLILTFGALVLGIGMLRGESSIERYLALQKSAQILDDTLMKIKNDNARLKKEINKIKNSPSYARKILKDKYHVTEENEKIVFFDK